MMIMTASAVLVLGAYLLGATLRAIQVEPSTPDDVRTASMVISGALLGLGACLLAIGVWHLWAPRSPSGHER